MQQNITVEELQRAYNGGKKTSCDDGHVNTPGVTYLGHEIFGMRFGRNNVVTYLTMTLKPCPVFQDNAVIDD